MKQILAIAGLTWKAAFRYRLFWVLAVLLLGAVVGLPLLLKDDGSAQGLTQILLTYTLSAITSLLGFATLWLACGTLARDVEDCQMQVVATKPIARWKIWLGKWLGIVGLNVALLTISGASVFFLLQYRAGHLPPDQQDILKQNIFVARASVKEVVKDIDPFVESQLQKIMTEKSIDPNLTGMMRQQIKGAVLAQLQVVPPGMMRPWKLHFGTALKERLKGVPLQLRFKFRTSDSYLNNGKTYLGIWRIAPDTAKEVRIPQENLPPESFQEFIIPPDLIDDNGNLTVQFCNANEVALLFGVDDGMEALYPEGTFGLNFIRGLGIILCWLALLATIGLAAASWLSFPVAAFFSLALLLVGLSSGTLSSAIEQGSIFGANHETNAPEHPLADSMLMPLFKGALKLIKLVEAFSPIDALSSGRSITWEQLGLAVAQIVLLMGGIFAAVGIFLFTKRELAAVQSNS